MRNAVQDDFLDEGTALFFKHIDDGIVFFGLAISRYEQVIFVDGQTLRRHGGADIRFFVFMMERQSGMMKMLSSGSMPSSSKAARYSSG